MNFRSEREGSICYVFLSGSIDAQVADSVESSFINLLEKERTILVDCSEMQFLSSSGMRALLVAIKESEKRKTQLFFYSFSEEVAHILEMAGLLKRFNHCATKEEALKRIL